MFDLVKSPRDSSAAELEAPREEKPAHQRFYNRVIKRIIDISAILVAAPVVLPVVLLFAVLIKRDGGPAFYGQKRVGRDGVEFTCWKLRSMVVDAEEALKAHLAANPEAAHEWDVHQKLDDDPRITKAGRFIRKTSIDELPQLLCVLKGEMSLVGPRPFMPDQKELYKGQAYYDLRPGLTGPWQVSDRNETSFAARAVYDNKYAADLSLLTDIGLLLRTVQTVLRATGK